MKHLFAATVGLIVMALVACGGPGEQVSTPVKTTPLAGTVNGKPWTAVSAIASAEKAFDDGGSRWIDIADHVQSCASFSNDSQVFGIVPWQVNNYDFSLTHNFTILERGDAGVVNHVAIVGRVELITAPADAGSTATLRIRAQAGAESSIEGEISVLVCD